MADGFDMPDNFNKVDKFDKFGKLDMRIRAAAANSANSAKETKKAKKAPRGFRHLDIPRGAITFTALSAIWLMLFILFFLVREGMPILMSVPISDIAAGNLWYPASEPALFGMLPLIAGSLAVTLLSSLLAIPFGVALALFISDICPRGAREFYKVSLEMLGFLPSVVLGFIGMTIVAPFLQMRFELLSGLNLTNASLLLGLMTLPTIASLSEESLRAVPQSQRDASYALGATRWETLRRVVLPGAKRGILQAGILGVMRSIGETMVVLMASGGAAVLPESIFDPVRPLTSTIAAEMGETPVGSEHYHALFFMGCLLILFTLVLNMFVLKLELGAGGTSGGGKR